MGVSNQSTFKMKSKRIKFINAHSSAKCRVGNSRSTHSHSRSLLTSPLVTRGYEKLARVTHRSSTLHPPDLRHPTELELGTTQGHSPFQHSASPGLAPPDGARVRDVSEAPLSSLLHKVTTAHASALSEDTTLFFHRITEGVKVVPIRTHPVAQIAPPNFGA